MQIVFTPLFLAINFKFQGKRRRRKAENTAPVWPSFLLCDRCWCVQNCIAPKDVRAHKKKSVRRNRRDCEVRYPPSSRARRERVASRKRTALLCIGVRPHSAPALVHMSALVLPLAWGLVVVSVSTASVAWQTDSIQLSVASTSDTFSLGLTASRYTILLPSGGGKR